MRLTVLGSGAACAGDGGNSSGYLVEDAGVCVLLDCGHGVASTLVSLRPASEIEHIVISHMHADHFIDLLALRFAVTKDITGLAKPQGVLHLPPGGGDALGAILDAVCFPPDFLSSVWNVCEYQSGRSIPLAPGLSARMAGGVHYIPGWGIRLDGSASLTYTGDTAPSDDLCELARGCDLLIAEATLAEPECGPVKGHLTGAQAAELASAAGVARLMLTHFWYDADRDATADDARRSFRGPIEIARDGLVIDV